jgi:hypothetical protein
VRAARPEQAKRLADQARALVVNDGLSPAEANALVLETAWQSYLREISPGPALMRVLIFIVITS